jgi:divalent metal cation (Fe/Co/Zn/Cd) transporter
MRMYRKAFTLALLTIVLSLAEGFASVFFGEQDGSLTLLGFGIDSFIEVISALGIAHMVLRIQRDQKSPRDQFEKTALKITGGSFYLLVVALLGTSIQKTISGAQPITTVPGVIISLVSIGVMFALMKAKLAVGRALRSDPIIADAHCTRVCIWMSVVLLIASAAYELTKIPFVDVLGSLGLAFLSYREGREALEKASNNASCGCVDD